MKIRLAEYNEIVVLTGAGVSRASGLPTYRGDGGLYESEEWDGGLQASAIAEDLTSVWRLFSDLRARANGVSPNAAHVALARAESQLPPSSSFTLITQNVDGLHSAAGSKNVLEIHGQLGRSRCLNADCGFVWDDWQAHPHAPACPNCGGAARPNVVLFGEELPVKVAWEAKRALRNCDLFIAIGTSGNVSPASNYVRAADYAGAKTLLVNLEPLDPPNPYFHRQLLGRAEELLPTLFT